MEDKPLSFEEAVAQLEQLVGEMESGALPLEDMIGRFEEGMKLVKLCRGKLDAMHRKIEVLVKDDGAAGECAEFNPDSERARAALKPVAGTPDAAPAPADSEDVLPF